MTRVGILVEGQEGLDWTKWRHLCVRVDQLGFDSLWRSDHLLSILGSTDRKCLETWASLALAAEWTRRIEFGPLVTPLTFRLPAVIARAAASVDELSGGRFVLGVGAGSNEREHLALGLPFGSTSQRLSNLEQGIIAIRSILTKYNPAPKRRSIPILVGGAGKSISLRIAATHADEYNVFDLSPGQFAAFARSLDEQCRSVGRAPESMRRSLSVGFLIGNSERELLAKAGALREVVEEYAALEPRQVLHSIRAQAPGAWVVGTPAEIVSQLAQYIPTRVDRFMLAHYLIDDLDSLDLLATTVLPELAALT